MNPLRDTAAQWLAEGRAAVVVEITRVEGSAPREAGTRLLVAAQATAGTIGGGHLEWLAIRTAQAALAARAALPDAQRHALGPSLGQCCGGVVWLSYRWLDAALVAQWPPAPTRLSVAVFGAGHVGRALAALLATLPVRLHWFDPLPADDEGAPVAGGIGLAPPMAGLVSCPQAEAVAELRGLPDDCHVLIMTHSHALDFDLCEAALNAARFARVGVIGSQTKAVTFGRRLRARGMAPDRAAELQCPIGLPGVSGREPAVIAVAVAAQLLSEPAPRTSQPPPRARHRSCR
jgi:xanthine dehydrogenase accessory factor